FLGNADAGIGDREFQHDVIGGEFLGADMHDDFARVGKLDGVAHQVDNDLPEAARAANQVIWNTRLDVTGYFQPFGVASKGQGLHAIAEIVTQAEGDFCQVKLSGFDLREVQDVIDEA